MSSAQTAKQREKARRAAMQADCAGYGHRRIAAPALLLPVTTAKATAPTISAAPPRERLACPPTSKPKHADQETGTLADRMPAELAAWAKGASE